jgi:DNA-binding response OmpR family regulator
VSEKLLIIEDDVAIQRGLLMNLKLEGYTVVGARDGNEGLRLYRQHKPDLILLDLMLPRKDGIEVLREIRATDKETRILILSAKDQEADKVLGLSLGADDYVTKPFGLAELLARVRALLRRARTEQSRVSSFGRVRIDSEKRLVTVGGNPVELTAREFDLLLFFVSHPGRVFSREQIMQAVWGIDHYGTQRTVDNFVARLRTKLEEQPERPRYFETVRGVGYRFDPTGNAA